MRFKNGDKVIFENKPFVIVSWFPEVHHLRRYLLCPEEKWDFKKQQIIAFPKEKHYIRTAGIDEIKVETNSKTFLENI